MKQYPTVIGIAGPARSGKDTVASLMASRLHIDDIDYRLQIYKMAGPIKEFLRNTHGWGGRELEGSLKEAHDYDWGYSPREAMQNIGAAMREVDPDFWVRIAMKAINDHDGITIIPDIRYENEALMVREMGGMMIHIQVRSREIEEIRDHKSEAGIDMSSKDWLIYNDSSLEVLKRMVNTIIDVNFP